MTSLQARIVSADRTTAASPHLSVEFIGLEGLSRIEPQWRALFGTACEPNPFFGPDFFLPLVKSGLNGHAGELALVWDSSAPERPRLIGFMPYRARAGMPFVYEPVLRSFSHPYISNGTPLIAADRIETATSALVEGFAARFPGHLLSLDLLRLDGAVATTLTAAAEKRGSRTMVAQTFERAALRAELPGEAYLKERVSSKKLRELRRCEGRLREAGSVAMRTLAGPEVKGGIREFLRIEASGWKGQRGTALACRPDTRAFAEALGDAAEPSILVDVLTVDGLAIAAALHLVGGSEAAAFKCAYDESFSRMSPGALLDLYAVRLALDERRFAVMDSCAIPGHSVEALWRDRIRMGQLLIDLRASPSRARLEGFAQRQEALLGWKSDAKVVIERLRRLRDEFRATLATTADTDRSKG